jgi:hypothetical protein
VDIGISNDWALHIRDIVSGSLKIGVLAVMKSWRSTLVSTSLKTLFPQ